jgi:hypothetical protein
LINNQPIGAVAAAGDFDYYIKTFSDTVTFDFPTAPVLDFSAYMNTPGIANRKYGAGLTISGLGVQAFGSKE